MNDLQQENERLRAVLTDIRSDLLYEFPERHVRDTIAKIDAALNAPPMPLMPVYGSRPTDDGEVG